MRGVANPGSVPARGRRHPMTVVTDARRLHDGGWNDAEIVRILARDGVHVTRGTIGRWVKPEQQRKHDAHSERWRRHKSAGRSGRLGPPNATPEFKLARIRALAEHDLGVASIAKVMRFDFGDHLSRHQIRYALKHDRYPTRATQGTSR